MRPMRIVSVVLLVVLAVGSAAAWPTLPGEIPTHFDLSGRPDSFAATSLASWFALPAIGVLTWALVLASSHFAIKHPSLLNIPHKQDFLELPEANRPPVARHIRELLDAVGVHVLLVFGIVQLAVYSEARGHPVPWLLPSVLVLTALLLPVVFFFYNPRIRDEIERQRELLRTNPGSRQPARR
ncbi:MAG TPA: DUF1648 domain-containing protein [Gemmatimonadaceae bacterium]|nr:DUF1648 domain-containing protein [Gemmatimonadaceae bacterium]